MRKSTSPASASAPPRAAFSPPSPAPGPRIPPIPPSKAKLLPACLSRCSATSAPTTSPPASAASSRGPRASAPASPLSIPPKSPWPPKSPASASSISSTPSAPAGAPSLLRLADMFLRLASCRPQRSRLQLPWTPAFLHKHGGLVLSIGQFNQWVGSQLMASGLVQIWPGTPVSRAAVRRTAPSPASASPIRASTKRRALRWLHARHGHPRATHRRRRRPCRFDRPSNRPKLELTEGTAPRLGAGNEVCHRAARRHRQRNPRAPAPSGTPSAIPSPRSSAFSTCIPSGSSPSASSSPPG